MRLSRIALATLAMRPARWQWAPRLTRDESAPAKARIEAEYEAERKKVRPAAGERTDVCVAACRGARKAGIAELGGAYKTSLENYYAAAIARAARSRRGRQRCDYQPREVRRDCVKDARVSGKRRGWRPARSARPSALGLNDPQSAIRAVIFDLMDLIDPPARSRSR